MTVIQVDFIKKKKLLKNEYRCRRVGEHIVQTMHVPNTYTEPQSQYETVKGMSSNYSYSDEILNHGFTEVTD